MSTSSAVPTVMVTGVGAIIGYGLLRSLRAGSRSVRLVGTDIYPDAIGQIWSDTFVQAPLTHSADYALWLEHTLREYGVDLLIPAIEQDVHAFSELRTSIEALGVTPALNDARLIDLTRDKWHMHQELAAIDSPARIPSRLEGDYETLLEAYGSPFLLKPRSGYASKGLVRIGDASTFEAHAHRLGEELLAQPIVGDDDQEYTVAVFGDGQGGVPASITLRRRLGPDGATSKARVEEPEGLASAVAGLCAHFEPVGPTNLQFRRDGAVWKLLEINPRVSSTTSLRRAFGYDEAAMCLDFYLDQRPIEQPTLRSGIGVRYIEDHVVHDRDHL